MAVFMRLLRILCYSALVIGGSGFLVIMILSVLGPCRSAYPEGFRCESASLQDFMNLLWTLVLFFIFAGLPLLLALGGIAFAIRDFLSKRK